MSAPSEIVDLVARFTEHAEAYRSGAYNEAQLRKEFVDPMFKALGWDMDNLSGYAEAYKDVIHEDAIKIGGATKAPDYCFRIGGTRKFFLEAKKPSVDIKSDAHPAFQLRRYAWSAKLPLSILTDFEEFAVYDCRVEPGLSDKAGVARVLYLSFTEYASRWDDIAKIFSRESILKGSFDKFAESNKAKRGTAQVDDAFLDEIEKWRADLSRNLALRNPKLSQRDLNFSVQRTIDRIVFLRICEDRRIEGYGRLQALLNGEHTYDRMRHLFREADERYNSGLFHFQKEKNRIEPPDDLTPGLEIDDDVLKKIIKRLYYPHSPYEFSVLPADILGQVYEQFLGKVIRLTENHQAKVEDKPEVKKAGGVYYTPTYIVDYIVENTVGKLLEGKTPKQAAKLRILDPACGSGSFLIGAYQYLLDWHRDWFFNDDPKKHATGRAPVLYQASGGEWKLTTTERKRILLQNIFGVDIDAQAVETTKLSLLLKVLEGESEQSLATQLRFFHERALPDLGRNIKCGNSLIGPDFYEQSEMLFLDEDERYRINVFDWNAEFPGIMKGGGFDAVIGNPPYIRSQTLGELQRRYYERRFKAATATYDIYVLFFERALSIASKQGHVGMILPNKFFTTDYGRGLRALLAEPNRVEQIVDFEDGQVFSRAGTYTCLLFVGPNAGKAAQYARLGKVFKESGKTRVAQLLRENEIDFKPLKLTRGGERWTLAVGEIGDLLLKLQRNFEPLSILKPHIFQGLKTSADKTYLLQVVKQKGASSECRTDDGNSVVVESDILRPVVRGEHVRRYSIDRSSGLHIVYPYEIDANGRATVLPSKTLEKKFPRAWNYLVANKSVLGARDRGIWANRADWYAYARSQNLSAFVGPKLLLPYMTTRLRTAPDLSDDLFFVNITTGGYGARFEDERHSLLYIAGLLNSRLLDRTVRQLTNAFRGGYFAVNKQALERLPFRAINFTDAVDKERHDRMVSLVERMLALHKRLLAATAAHQTITIQRQIDATDAQIDKLVYELYDLTADEIKIVEGAKA
ncbi:MAG: restriction endonuclease subunit M [Chthoniobacterales bacterium]|nr:MAG: restriction endonuclease subunit M [Chthoniobacterales bacterium]